MDHKDQKGEAEFLSALKRIVNVPPDATDIERKAMIFAYKKHSEVNQKRKYSGKHYIVHPAAVAELVRSVDHIYI